MSVLVWFRDKLFGKVEVKSVEPQITDAVTVKKTKPTSKEKKTSTRRTRSTKKQ